MRVDRLQIECVMSGGAYTVGVTSWDGLKGRLCHIGTYSGLSFWEMNDVVGSTIETYRPGTEFFLTDGQISVQAPLFD